LPPACSGPVFQPTDRFSQEGIGLNPSTARWVSGLNDVNHWPDEHHVFAVVFPYFEPLFNLSNTEDGRLGKYKVKQTSNYQNSADIELLLEKY